MIAMPPLTRWFVRTALAYFVAALLGSILIQVGTNRSLTFQPPSPRYNRRISTC